MMEMPPQTIRGGIPASSFHCPFANQLFTELIQSLSEPAGVIWLPYSLWQQALEVQNLLYNEVFSFLFSTYLPPALLTPRTAGVLQFHAQLVHHPHDFAGLSHICSWLSSLKAGGLSFSSPLSYNRQYISSVVTKQVQRKLTTHFLVQLWKQELKHTAPKVSLSKIFYSVKTLAILFPRLC